MVTSWRGLSVTRGALVRFGNRVFVRFVTGK